MGQLPTYAVMGPSHTLAGFCYINKPLSLQGRSKTQGPGEDEVLLGFVRLESETVDS